MSHNQQLKTKEEISNKNYSDNFHSNFPSRHIGPDDSQIEMMLDTIDVLSLDKLIDQTVPDSIRLKSELNIPLPLSEHEALSELKEIAKKNIVARNFIGQGYYGTLTPGVILRNIFENPSWYTQYTPYQAEIAQGRLEALLNFQTMICDFTGLPIANSSLLDEGTAVAEAVTMAWRVKKSLKDPVCAVHSGIHPQSLEVLETRAEPLGISIKIVNSESELNELPNLLCAVLQTPQTDGNIINISDWSKVCKSMDSYLIVASDLMALCLLENPTSFGADIVVGNSQRFGVPLGFGGPHAGFMACSNIFQREIPGRIVGVSKDISGKPAYRLALQTREQHIKRERATSNICTAQVLLAVIASMYAVYHGPNGLKKIANKIALNTSLLANLLKENGISLKFDNFFDTIRTVPLANISKIRDKAEKSNINLRYYSDNSIGISLDERSTLEDISELLCLFTDKKFDLKSENINIEHNIPKSLLRTSSFLTHKVFNSHHSETEMLRYIKSLELKDLSLTHSMIPLGSCTMKLNASSEMIPVSWEEFSNIHPFAPSNQVEGYKEIFKNLSDWIGDITGLPAVSLQPNAGSQGEYAGLLTIRNYHISKGEGHRTVCLIPSSAHGTNPASAQMAGMQVVVVKCDDSGNIDLEDLKEKANTYKENLAALMVTYPSTHGVFEEHIKDCTSIVHEAGAYVYMDGANLNAQVGLCKASEIGADVCHLNLHKTFCIPHGGGGPGMGPIAAIKEFAPYLPGHKVSSLGGKGAVSSAAFGSASILLISWSYIRMMGAAALTRATEIAILNANYIAKRLEPHYKILYKGKNGRIAHECIIDLRHLKKSIGIDVTDIAKRLMDFGFHAPTVSFPVPETMMIEPTESESKKELDYFCDAMLAIYDEIKEVESGSISADESPLRNAPHTIDSIIVDNWDKKYSRERAVYPLKWVKDRKFWPSCGRIDSAYGDRNFHCQCLPISEYE